ncbi:hypothetical protein [Paenibacillus tianjinensis]|uniref:Small acid-soluble spore protein P n=1 Tax=Paenibacillus tianjinensis TaxID=2810347 RepID=A0ABX7L4T9_9BACL|nr:hypothetical protein [Paenibacillus tianjinensis]QSF42980.1 hypothetical protein JRJ22_16945 [Paenibacillus tianjinensis]
MGKNRVWNKGKHNGGGLAKRSNPVKSSAEAETSPANIQQESNPRIDTVKPMNRSNWVVRPARVSPKDNENNKQ